MGRVWQWTSGSRSVPLRMAGVVTRGSPTNRMLRSSLEHLRQARSPLGGRLQPEAGVHAPAVAAAVTLGPECR